MNILSVNFIMWGAGIWLLTIAGMLITAYVDGDPPEWMVNVFGAQFVMWGVIGIVEWILSVL